MTLLSLLAFILLTAGTAVFVAAEFSLTALARGDYTIIEKDAPAGYYADRSVHDFTIGSEEPGALDVVDVGKIENEPINPPTLPLTGGLGTDAFLMVGGGLLLLAGLGGWIHRRRSLRAHATRS